MSLKYDAKTRTCTAQFVRNVLFQYCKSTYLFATLKGERRSSHRCFGLQIVPFSTTVALFDSFGYANVSTLQNVLPVYVLLSAPCLATEQVISTETRVSDMLFPEIDEARERVSEIVEFSAPRTQYKGGPKNKPLPNYQKIVLNRNKVCQ